MQPNRFVVVRINLTIVLVVACVLISSGAYEIRQIQMRAQVQQQKDGSVESQRLAHELSGPLHDYDYERITEAVKEAMANQDIASISVRDRVDGKVINAFGRTANWQVKPADANAPPTNMLNYQADITSEGETLGEVTVYLTDQFLQQRLWNEVANRLTILGIVLVSTAIALALAIHINVLTPLLKLRKVFESVATGNLDAEIDTSRTDEIGSLARSFASMRNSVREKINDLHYLTRHLHSVQEKERTYIAREVHDELGQALTGLKMQAVWLKRQLARPGDPLTAEAACDKLDSMTELIDTTIGSVRRIATELRPAILDTMGLIPALEWQAQEFQNRTGIACEFVTLGLTTSVDREVSTAVFRIFQESLTNVARHSKAQHVVAHLEENPEGLLLEVHDDGIGIDMGQSPGSTSFGLLGMKERALLLGGELAFTGEPGHGTTITLKVPFHWEESQASRVSWRAT